MLWEQYKQDPAQNNAEPPIGAPENTLRQRDLNNIARRMMAAMAEMGDWITTIAGGKTTTAQSIYDMMFPIGSHRIVLTANAVQFNVGANTSSPVYARWELQSGLAGASWVFAGSYAPAGLFTEGNWTPTTDPGGAHSHGGLTGGRALTINQIPAHSHGIPTYPNQNVNGSANAPAAGSGTAGSQITDNTGGSQAHDHTIAGSGTHTHALTINPPRVGVYVARRIA